MKNTETGEIITTENQGGKPVIKSKEVNKESEDTLLKKTLYIKDKYNISNEAYHELAMTNPEIPSSYRLLKTVKEINSESIIRSTPEKAIGIQQSLKERLTKRLHHIHKVNPKFQQSIIQVKITGDGNICDRICQNPPLTHTMAKNVFHHQSIDLSISQLTVTTPLPQVDWSAFPEACF